MTTYTFRGWYSSIRSMSCELPRQTQLIHTSKLYSKAVARWQETFSGGHPTWGFRALKVLKGSGVWAGRGHGGDSP